MALNDPYNMEDMEDTWAKRFSRGSSVPLDPPWLPACSYEERAFKEDEDRRRLNFLILLLLSHKLRVLRSLRLLCAKKVEDSLVPFDFK